jgi:phosphotransferase system enzyme I (PtsI)
MMLPMISTIKEIRQAKAIIEECKSELRKSKTPFDKELKVGIMIEVPSAALLTGDFAKEVDFLSIGTNDLIQYLMAVDRGNDLVSDLFQEFSPSVVRTLHHIVREAKKSNKSVSLCGEMAADTLAIPLLVGLGLESLSMSPSTIAYAKRIIRSCSMVNLKQLADDCLLYVTQEEILNRIERFFKDNSITRTRNII